MGKFNNQKTKMPQRDLKTSLILKRIQKAKELKHQSQIWSHQDVPIVKTSKPCSFRDAYDAKTMNTFYNNLVNTTEGSTKHKKARISLLGNLKFRKNPVPQGQKQTNLHLKDIDKIQKEILGCVNQEKGIKKNPKSCKNLKTKRRFKNDKFSDNQEQKVLYEVLKKNKYKITHLNKLGDNYFGSDSVKKSSKVLDQIVTNPKPKPDQTHAPYWDDLRVCKTTRHRRTEPASPAREGVSKLSTDYDFISQAVRKNPSVGKAESYRTLTTIHNYSPKYRDCLTSRPKAFNRVQGEFSYMHDISKNHEFIKKNIWK